MEKHKYMMANIVMPVRINPDGTRIPLEHLAKVELTDIPEADYILYEQGPTSDAGTYHNIQTQDHTQTQEEVEYITVPIPKNARKYNKNKSLRVQSARPSGVFTRKQYASF